MRIISLKTSLLLLAVVLVVATVVAPTASATTLNLTSNNLKGISGSVGTVTLTQSGANVDVTIVMNSGYSILTEGGFLGFDLKGGLTLSNSSLNSFSVSGISDKLHSHSSIGSFTFSQLFQTHHKGGQLFVTTLSFTIQNASVSQITGLGIHFCVVSAGDCSATGFAVTGQTTSVVPEPSTLGLLGTGFLGIAGLLRRRLA